MNNDFGRSRGVFITGAIVTGLAVVLGAFGAHGLKGHTDPHGLNIWETGVRYQAMHGLALLIMAAAWTRYSERALRIIFWCFLVGTVIFSGSLYVLVLSGLDWMGAITPIGGVLFLIGWGFAAFAHRK